MTGCVTAAEGRKYPRHPGGRGSVSGPSHNEILYLRTRNVLQRLLGLASALAGAALLIRGALIASGTLGPHPEAAYVVAGAVCLVCGAVGLLARGSRPDLGAYAGRRSWWTGDPIERIAEQQALAPRTGDSGG